MAEETEVSSTGDLKSAANETFDKVSTYLRAELSVTLEDYKLLEEINRVTTNKYHEMNKITSSVSASVVALQDKYSTVTEKLDEIDAIEEKVAKLEEMAYSIDAYSKRLEAQFKQLERK